MAIAGREHAEGIDEPRVDEGLEAGPLLVSEAFLADVAFRMCKVQFGVGNVEVAAELSACRLERCTYEEAGSHPVAQVQTDGLLWRSVYNVDRRIRQLRRTTCPRSCSRCSSSANVKARGEMSENPCDRQGSAALRCGAR